MVVAGAGNNGDVVVSDDVLAVVDGERAFADDVADDDERDDDISKGTWLFVSVAHTTGDNMPGMSLFRLKE